MSSHLTHGNLYVSQAVTYVAGDASTGGGLHGGYAPAGVLESPFPRAFFVSFAAAPGDRRLLLAPSDSVMSLDACDACFEVRLAAGGACEIRAAGGDVVARAQAPVAQVDAFWINVADRQLVVGVGLATWQHIFMVVDTPRASLVRVGFSSGASVITYSGILFADGEPSMFAVVVVQIGVLQICSCSHSSTTSPCPDPYEYVVGSSAYVHASKRGAISIDAFELRFRAQGYAALGVALIPSDTLGSAASAVLGSLDNAAAAASFEIVLGAHNNSQSQLRRGLGGGGELLVHAAGEPLSPREYSDFWVTLTEDGDFDSSDDAAARGLLLSFGSGSRIGKYAIASYSIPRPRTKALLVAFARLGARPVAVLEPLDALAHAKAMARARILLATRQATVATRALHNARKASAQHYSRSVTAALVSRDAERGGLGAEGDNGVSGAASGSGDGAVLVQLQQAALERVRRAALERLQAASAAGRRRHK